jgi:hypothetical protein
MGLKRMAISIHSIGAPLDLPTIASGATFLDTNKMIHDNTPSTMLNYLVMKALQIYMLGFLILGDRCSEYLPIEYWPTVRDCALMLCVPNIIRQYSLVVMSNCSHYYGDIPVKSPMFQNQILDHWTLYIFQFFCFNFGATHIIHHYVPGQPFYVRNLVYNRVKSNMIAQGVRHNDFGIVHRANRFFSSSTQITTEEQAYEAFVANPSNPPLENSMYSLQAWLTLTSTVGLAMWYAVDSAIMMTLLKRAFIRFVLKKNPNAL